MPLYSSLSRVTPRLLCSSPSMLARTAAYALPMSSYAFCCAPSYAAFMLSPCWPLLPPKLFPCSPMPDAPCTFLWSSYACSYFRLCSSYGHSRLLLCFLLLSPMLSLCPSLLPLCLPPLPSLCLISRPLPGAHRAQAAALVALPPRRSFSKTHKCRSAVPREHLRKTKEQKRSCLPSPGAHN